MNKIGIIKKARLLRKEDTKTERILWKTLRGTKLGVRFRRQHPIDMYILDFYSPKSKLCVELDGSPHKMKENKEYDEIREEYLRIKGIKTLRFWNSEIEKDMDAVLEKIRKESDFSPLKNYYLGEGSGVREKFIFVRIIPLTPCSPLQSTREGKN